MKIVIQGSEVHVKGGHNGGRTSYIQEAFIHTQSEVRKVAIFHKDKDSGLSRGEYTVDVSKAAYFDYNGRLQLSLAPENLIPAY